MPLAALVTTNNNIMQRNIFGKRNAARRQGGGEQQQQGILCSSYAQLAPEMMHTTMRLEDAAQHKDLYEANTNHGANL